MRRQWQYSPEWVFILCGLLFLGSCNRDRKDSEQDPEMTFYTMDDFGSVRKVDAHVHIRTADTAYIEQARKDNFQLLTIVVEEPPGIESQKHHAIEHAGKFSEVVKWVTTFSIDGWGTDTWEKEVIEGLGRDFDHGAIGVKVYKIIGMDLMENGKNVMVDDSRLSPVFSFLSGENIPVIGHLGEPRNCWLPVEEMTNNSDKRYFSRHPEYHMYLHPEKPSYEDQIRARDQVLENHPDLSFVGAHFGSMEWSTEMMADHLDRYPNLMLDMAARISSIQYLTMKDRGQVRDFFIQYGDRLVYGTDRIASDQEDMQEFVDFVHRAWVADWEFFVTDHPISARSFDGEFTGLKLPRSVIDQIYYRNATKVFPVLGSR